MVTVLEVPAEVFIGRLAEYLKKNVKEIQPPEWAPYVKTGVDREHPPMQEDWWYIRAASMMRKLYKSGEPIGVGTFRVIYGGRKNYGSAPEHFVKASGTTHRKILQQLEKAGLVTRVPGRGRILTPKAVSIMDRIAYEILKQLAAVRPELKKYFE
uniref:Small ribosomal subunit protein eS19 n=1 Tax=Fervidicoccus fontis TaxID=683846 RepID=A0A7J3ZJ68_9CREN